MLGQKLTNQKLAVEQYSRALVAANQKLVDSHARQEKMTQALEEAKQQYAALPSSISLARARYEAWNTAVGEGDARTQQAKAELDALEQEYKDLGAEIKKLEGQLVAGAKTLQNNADAISTATTNLNNAKAAVKTTEAEIRKLTEQLYRMKSHWTQAGEYLTAFAKKCDTVSKAMVSAGRGMSKALTTPILALGTAAIKSSIDYETAFASVRKTVDATEEEFASLSGSIKEMSTQVASSGADIAEVMAVAGQLGIANSHLVEFTHTMIDLGNSTDIVAQDAASTLAKFANITGMSQSEFGNLGSALVDLGNNYATTESEIMEMSKRLAAAGHQVGLTESQILGFATALSSVGIEAQMGGSAFSKALVKMEVASATGGAALNDFAQVSGMSAKAFKTLWDSDPAAAFQSFIVGLSKLDDEGESAIKTLEDIGIKEVRLRDTLLRATNANELFSKTQKTANKAWTENSALTIEANKRYATTASQLTNLKNTAALFGQQIGDDLNPTIRDMITRANELLASFMEMEQGQRRAIVQFAGMAAAAGPAILVLGKTIGAVGKTSAAMGKFATSMGKFSAKVSVAGGGIKGLAKVALSSKLGVAALSAALIYGAYALYDYASGAKESREALEGMAATAKKWKDNAADTFFSKAGLSLFGMSDEDFARSKESADTWIAGVLASWSDGQKDTDEIVGKWTESFKSLTASTREELSGLNETAKQAGLTEVSSQIEADMKTLDSMDKEIESLLKKRQNKNLTDKDKVRLQALIDAREEIEIKYRLAPADVDGFETIKQKVEAEVARAQARGQKGADVSVYQNAMVAAAQGMAAVNAQIDAQYDKEYALIQLMAEGAEKEQALSDLNAKYNADRKAATEEYAETLKGVVTPVLEQPEIQRADKDLDALTQKLRAYSAASESDKPGILTEMEKLASGMDERAMTEYLATLTQIQSLIDGGMTEGEVQQMLPALDFSGTMEQIAAIQQFLKDRDTVLPGLATMFGESLPEEILKITTDLDMTGAQARWNEFAANPGVITTDAVVQRYSDTNAVKPKPDVIAIVSTYVEKQGSADKAGLKPEGLIAYINDYQEKTGGADVSGLTPENVTALVSAYKELNGKADISTLKPDEITAYVKGYLENAGVDVSKLKPSAITAFVAAYQELDSGASTLALTPRGIIAYVQTYAEATSGADVSGLTPENVTALVSAYREMDAGADMSTLKPDEITAYIQNYLEKEGVDTAGLKPEGITAFVLAYEEMKGGALTTALTPEDITAMVGKYLEAAGVDISALKPDEIEALVSSYAEAASVDKSALLKAFTAYVDAYEETPVAKATLKPSAQVSITGYDLTAYNAFVAANPVKLNGIVRVGTVYENPEDVLNDPNATFWESGKQISVNLVPANKIDDTTLMAYDADGTMHVLITPEVGGTPEGVENARGGVTDKKVTATTGWDNKTSTLDLGPLGSLAGMDVMDQVKRLTDAAKYLEASKGTWATLWGLMDGASKTGVENQLATQMNPENLAALSAYISEVVALIQNGGEVSKEDAANLQAILDFVSSLEVAGVGQNIVAGIGDAMAAAGWLGYASTVSGNLLAAVNAALGINSPATTMIPTGTSVGEGIAQGMTGYGFGAAGATVSSNIKSGVGNLTSVGKTAGKNFSQGIAQGITSGAMFIRAAASRAAKAAKEAAEQALKEHSPSRVGMEIGGHFSRGIALGVADEKQLRAIRNASRYIAGSLSHSASQTIANDNRRFCDQRDSGNVTVHVDSLAVKDPQDVRALAIEISRLNRRVQFGYGGRG
ncbi:MAG: phage tail tape measure protein [Clostridia bacterium]